MIQVLFKSHYTSWIVSFHLIPNTLCLFCLFNVKIPLQVKKVKSELAPDLKVTFRMHANYVPSFMLLSQSAKRKCLAALIKHKKNLVFRKLIIRSYMPLYILKCTMTRCTGKVIYSTNFKNLIKCGGRYGLIIKSYTCQLAFLKSTWV